MTQETPAGETPSQPDEVMYCATHPKVETTLRCGKCGTPICPKCMVMTPVGARCRTCANVRPMAMYEVKPELLLRGLLAGVVSALIGAAIFLFFLRAFIFFTSFFYGFIVAQAIEYASNRKRGPTMQILGVACVLLGAFGALFLGGFLMGGGSPATAMLAVMSVFRGDLLFFLFVAIASVIVWNRLS